MELEEKSEQAEFYKSKCKNLEDHLQRAVPPRNQEKSWNTHYKVNILMGFGIIETYLDNTLFQCVGA